MALPERYESTTVQDATQAAAGLERWWTSFGDPRLSAVVETALLASPDAQSARLRLQEARVRRSTALAGFGPRGAPSITRSRLGSDLQDLATHTDVADLTVSWEVDFLGRGRVARQRAEATLDAAAYDNQASRAAIAAAAAQAYFDVHGLSCQAVEAAETARIAQDLARLGQMKAERGLVSRADAASLNAEAATSRAQQVALEAQAQAARRVLLVLLGRGSEARDQLDVTIQAISAPPPPPTAPGDLLRRRPDLLSAERQVRAAAGAVVSAKLAYLPTLSLRPEYTRTASVGQGVSLWTLAANATAPFLDLPRLRGEVRIADARAEQAVVSYERAVQVAYGEADRALLQVAADRERLIDLVDAEAQAKAAFDSQDQAYRAGYVDFPSLLLTERAWRAARASLTAGQNAVLTDTVIAFKALGGGWSPATTDVKPSPTQR